MRQRSGTPQLLRTAESAFGRHRRRRVNSKFAKLVVSPWSRLQKLMEMEPVRAEKLPQSKPKRGIYLLSDGDIHF